jgi:hypothetical protein
MSSGSPLSLSFSESIFIAWNLWDILVTVHRRREIAEQIAARGGRESTAVATKKPKRWRGKPSHAVRLREAVLVINRI